MDLSIISKYVCMCAYTSLVKEHNNFIYLGDVTSSFWQDTLCCYLPKCQMVRFFFSQLTGLAGSHL